MNAMVKTQAKGRGKGFAILNKVSLRRWNFRKDLKEVREVATEISVERRFWDKETAQERFYCCCCYVASVMSDSVQPHRQQPTRLPCPWDSPGKNTGVGCHFLLQSMKVKSESEVAQSCPTLSDPMHCSLPGSSVHGIFQARVLEWGAIAFSEERF